MNIRRLITLSFIVLLAACSSEPEDTTPTLNRGLPSAIESIDPQKARSTQASEILRELGEGLMTYSVTGEVVGGGAESWVMSEDGLTYTFTLRENLRWSNGEPLIAAHYVAGLQRLVNPDTAAFYAGSVGAIRNANDIIAGDQPVESLGIEATDDRTVEITLVQPTSYFLALLTHPSTYPVYPPGISGIAEASTDASKLITSGAYRVADWQPGSIIRMRRNEHYWDAANVAIEAVNYHVLTEALTEYNRYRAGELDITSNIPPDRFEQAREERPDEVRIAPYLAVYYYGYNLTKPPFSDNPKLRTALSVAIDRVALVEKVTGRGELPAYSWVPPGTHNYEPPQPSYADMNNDERIALAKRLYREAGYGDDNPLEIELRYNTSDVQQRIALAIADMWSEVLGVETQLVNEEFQVLLANVRDAEITQVFRLSWIGDFDDAYTFLHILQSGSPSNMPRYENPEFDDLMRRAEAQTDPKARRLYLEEAELVMLRDQPVIPIYFYVSKHLVSPRVVGWQDNPLDNHYSRYLSLRTE